MIVGLTLATRPHEVYRALVEATAFGARKIVETFEESGVPVEDFVVAGGLQKNAFLMQIYADVLRRPLHLIGSEQGPALGSAIHAAVAAGLYADIHAACDAMGSQIRDAYLPDEATPTPTTSSTPTTCACTTTSAAAATTSCTRCGARARELVRE